LSFHSSQVNLTTAPRVLLGVSGGIAAYKSAELIRLLRAAGAEVRVVMTAGATAFITTLSLQALSGNAVRSELLDPSAEAGMSHIELARWADLVVVAPASADLIARLAAGMANDLLTTLMLATAAPVHLAPAMNRRMWLHPATQENVTRLCERGVHILGPDAGEQACGEVGPGRMLEPPEIVARLALRGRALLARRRVLVTAGPTREPLDPARYIGNRSSGRMGYAVAESLARLGAEVTVVSGPTSLPPPQGARVIRIESAAEMETAVMEQVAAADIFVAAAAVADYRPANYSAHKIKKGQTELTLRLVRNPDILARVAALSPPLFVVGFAAETERLAEHAFHKLETKGLDMIAANLVGGASGGFERAENALTVLWRGGQQSFPTMPKTALGAALAELIAERYLAHTPSQDP
jgi:phosphopantothenoylcysteine decarboxylase/phosphopantothenate--cysteine ligase